MSLAIPSNTSIQSHLVPRNSDLAFMLKLIEEGDGPFAAGGNSTVVSATFRFVALTPTLRAR
jgi:hypothetical protein